MSATVLISIIAMILVVIFGVSITVLVSKALSNAFRTLDRMHERNGQHVDTLLDRLVAIDWEKFAALKAMEDPAEGGFIVPEDQQEEGSIEVPRKWGSLRALRERTTLTPDEERLLAEDEEEMTR